MKVIVTRPRAQAQPLVGRLEGLGFDVVECPLIEIIGTSDAPIDCAGYEWAIVTSPNGADEVARLGVPIVFDHFGGAQAAVGTGQAGFAALLALVKAGHAYVKVSAAYRSSDKAPAYDDVAPLAEALIAANPDRILWGTDWPHPHAAAPGAALDRVTPSYDIDDGLALNQLRLWAPNAAIRRKILVGNPARLYDF
jgi:predicted TIM-barrel fold metal-dependent hydrolase